jgi:hypothetical protein
MYLLTKCLLLRARLRAEPLADCLMLYKPYGGDFISI